MTTSFSPSATADAAASGNRNDLSSAYVASVRRRWVKPLVIGLTFMGLGGGAWALTEWTRSQQTLATLDLTEVASRTFDVILKEKGELKAAKSTDVICEVEGRSTIISLIPEGTAVQKGDLLVQLASDEIEDRIRQEELKEANAITAVEVARTDLDVQRDKNMSDVRKADLTIELARLELEKYQKGEWAQRLKDAEVAIEQATIMLERREEDFAAAKQLYEKKYVTKTEYQEDEFNHQKAIWDLDKAKKAKEVLEAYTHVAELRQKESDYEEAQKERVRVEKNAEAQELQKQRSLEGKEKELALIQDQLAKFRRQQEKCRITAPTQGFVVYFSESGRFMSNDNQIREGGTVHERQVILSLPDTTEMLVVVRVHEAKTNKLVLGQSVRVSVEGIPGRVFEGKVTKIAALADTQNRWLNPDLKEYETEITLDASEAVLKPGVTAYAEILVDSVTDKLAVPVQSIYARGGKRYVFRADGSNPAYAEVTLGAIGNEWAEIREGLKLGDDILLAYGDEQKRLIPEPRDVDGNSGPAGDRLNPHGGQAGKSTPKPAGQGETSRTVTPKGAGKSASANADSSTKVRG